MTTYNTLKKIIPPDQALANQALSRSLRQVKDIFNSDLPSLSAAVSQLESNKDLDLISSLTEPIPDVAKNFVVSTLATGTGPGNTVTINDVVGTAAGGAINPALPVIGNVILELTALGALTPLTANGGSSGSVDNGLYTLMLFAAQGAYSASGNTELTTTIPATNFYPGPRTFSNASDAFQEPDGLIAVANGWINGIAANNVTLVTQANDASNTCANQLVLNVVNCAAAGIDLPNLVSNIANADLVANSVSSVLGFTAQLHDLGLDITDGGSAQFLQEVANIDTLSGQAVIASMREGRNIAVLNAVGIQLDTQLVDLNPNTTVANNLQDAQYSVAEARANIII
jgi:hypothetical protein